MLMCPCLFAQQGKPTPTPTSVIVANTDAQPVPVTIVPAAPEADMVTIVNNTVPDPTTADSPNKYLLGRIWNGFCLQWGGILLLIRQALCQLAGTIGSSG